MKRFRASVLPFLLLLFGLLATGVTVAASLDEDDVEFMEKAAIAGMFEIESSELAKARATQADVKAFADMMIRDHTKMAAELKSLAQRKTVALPSVLDDKHQEMVEELAQEEEGQAFDDAYAEAMVDSHDEAVELFEDAAENAKDPEVKALASKSLSTLKMHHMHAEQLEDGDG